VSIDGFLRIDGIDGESRDADHPGWLDVTGFEWGLSQEALPSMDGTLSAGTPTVRTARFSDVFGRASPGLFRACCTGRQIAAMTFESRVNFGDEHFTVLRVELKDCLVTSVETGSAGEFVTEQIEVAFRSILVEAKERPQ
jgi:type VI secretion system secreted protein Hcp